MANALTPADLSLLGQVLEVYRIEYDPGTAGFNRFKERLYTALGCAICAACDGVRDNPGSDILHCVGCNQMICVECFRDGHNHRAEAGE